MKKTKKAVLSAIFAVVFCICMLFGVRVSFTTANAADSYTVKSVSGDSLTISCAHSEGTRICIKIAGNDWKDAGNNFEFKATANADAWTRLENLHTFDFLTLTAKNNVDAYFNFYTVPGVMNFQVYDLTEFTIPKGTKFPSYAYVSTGSGEVYELSQAVKFTRANAKTKDWSTEVIVETTTVEVDATITDVNAGWWEEQYNAYWLNISLGGKNILPKDGAAAYYVNDNAAKNGVDFAEYIYINGVSVRSALTANANGTTSYVGTEVRANGGVYAPVSIYNDGTQLEVKIMKEYVNSEKKFSICLKSGFEWENTDGEKLVLKEDAKYAYSSDGKLEKYCEVDLTDSVTLTENKDFRTEYNVTYLTLSFGEKKLTPWNVTGLNSENSYQYYVNDHATQNGMDWAEYLYINDVSVRSVLTANKSSDTYKHGVLFPLNQGGQFAPIFVYVEQTQIAIAIMQERADFESFTLTLKKDFLWKNADGEFLTVAKDITFRYESGHLLRDDTEVVLTVNAQGTSQTMVCKKNSTVDLSKITDGDKALLGVLQDGKLYPAKTYTVGESSASVDVAFADFALANGASIRAIGNSGIRFTYQLAQADYDAYKDCITELGIMLLPTDTLGDTAFTLDNFMIGTNIVVGSTGKTKQLLNATSGAYEYILRLTNLKEANYARAFSARGYMKVTYADGTTAYVYTPYTEENNSRSIAEVAQRCADNVNGRGEYYSMSDDAQANIANYISVGETKPRQNYVINVSALTVDAIKAAYTQALALTDAQLKGYGDVAIQLPSGTLELTETLQFEGGRVHGREIRFVGNNTTISGGKTLSGLTWTAGSNGIYSTNVDVGSSKAIRQLYVDGKPATLARTNTVSATRDQTTSTTFKVKQSDLSGLTMSGSMEISSLEKWAQSYAVVGSVTTSSEGIFLSKTDYYNFTLTDASSYVYSTAEGYMTTSPTIFLQNNLNFLDEVNEFYYDSTSGKLYYKPENDVNIGELTFTVPVTEKLLTTQGMVKDVAFEGITFAYSAFNAPATYGYRETQGGLYKDQNNSYNLLPCAVVVDSYNVRMENCTVTCVGANGIGVERGAKNAVLNRNTFSYTAGSAMRVGDCNDWDAVLPTNITLTNNTVEHFGLVYGGAPGIMVGYADTVTVSQNTISDGCYSGISAGYGWTSNENSKHRNYTITYNRISNVMNSELHDGGGIYVMGTFVATTSNLIANNYVEMSSGCIAAIYLDEGSSYYTVENNVLVMNVKSEESAAIFLHNNVQSKNKTNGMREITVTGNYLKDNNGSNSACVYKYAISGTQNNGTYTYLSEIDYSNPTNTWSDSICNTIQTQSGVVTR